MKWIYIGLLMFGCAQVGSELTLLLSPIPPPVVNINLPAPATLIAPCWDNSVRLTKRESSGVQIYKQSDPLYRHKPYLDCLKKPHQNCIDGNYWTEDEWKLYKKAIKGTWVDDIRGNK